VLALPSSTVVVADTVITIEPIAPDIEAGLAAAYANRQDLRLAQLGVENRRAGLRDAHRTSPVTLYINTTMGFDGSSDAAQAGRALREAFGDQNRSNSINLGVDVPLFDRFQERNAVARARNDLRSAEISLADQRRRLEGEVTNAAELVNNASTELDLAEKQFDLTRRTLEIQTRRFAAGAITSVEFLIDQASAREAEIGLLGAKLAMLKAIEDWKRAIGERSGLSAVD
jgi:outer membrane protein